MSIEELLKLQEELQQKYEEEKALYEACQSRTEKAVLYDVIMEISKELLKVKKLLEIYQSSTNINMNVYYLEKLYMFLASGLDENKFNHLDDDKIFKLFDRYFPEKWVYESNIEEKEKRLLDAICRNEFLEDSKYKNK